MIIFSTRYGQPLHMLNVASLTCTVIFPAILGLICFADSRSKLLPPLYLAYALCILFLGGVFRHFTLLNTAFYLGIIYICLFALTFLGKGFSSSGIGAILKLLLLVLTLAIIVLTVVRIRFMFIDYFKPSHLCNALLAVNAASILLSK